MAKTKQTPVPTTQVPDILSDLSSEMTKLIGGNDDQLNLTSWLSTGIYGLNKIISGYYTKGYPVGRVTEIFGESSCGKTMLATQALIETQKKGGLAVFIDYEHSLDLLRAELLGLDISPTRFRYKQPDTAEEGAALIFAVSEFIRERSETLPLTIVVDSIASMIPKSEDEAILKVDTNMSTNTALSKFLSTYVRKWAQIATKRNFTLILLNQTREKVGVLFGDKHKTSGGTSVPFYGSVRIKLTKSGKIKDPGGNFTGELIKAEARKNKVAIPFQTCSYFTHVTKGIDEITSNVEELKRIGIIEKKGAYICVDGQNYTQAKYVEMLSSNQEELDKFNKIFEDLDKIKMEEVEKQQKEMKERCLKK